MHAIKCWFFTKNRLLRVFLVDSNHTAIYDEKNVSVRFISVLKRRRCGCCNTLLENIENLLFEHINLVRYSVKMFSLRLVKKKMCNAVLDFPPFQEPQFTVFSSTVSQLPLATLSICCRRCTYLSRVVQRRVHERKCHLYTPDIKYKNATIHCVSHRK